MLNFQADSQGLFNTTSIDISAEFYLPACDTKGSKGT